MELALQPAWVNSCCCVHAASMPHWISPV